MKVAVDAKQVQRLLNGFLCVHKLRDTSVRMVINSLKAAICTDGNELDDSMVPTIEMPVVEAHPKTGALLVVDRREQLDYTLHPLMCGKLFLSEDIEIRPLETLGPSSSGICVLGINETCGELDDVDNLAWLNEYVIQGEFGLEKEKHEIRGQIVAKAKYDHITEHMIRKLFSKIKLQYKRMSYELSNVDLQSQEAFDLVRRGAPRPRVLGSPVIYDVQLRAFNPPKFTISVQITGETDYFLRALIHEIGCGLGSLACPRRLRRVRQGPFTETHALLSKHFRLVPILQNIQMCNKIFKKKSTKYSDVIEMRRIDKKENELMLARFGLNDDAELSEPQDCVRFVWDREYTKL